MNATEAFDKIVAAVKKQENFVPRNYQSIGGMWTVDSWRLGDIGFQLADEGYTDIINHPTVRAYRTFSSTTPPIVFSNGTEEDLIKLAESLT